MTTHEGDILKIIELGRQLGYPIPPIRIMGIEPERMDLSMNLSTTLQCRFDEYVGAAIQELKRTWTTRICPET